MRLSKMLEASKLNFIKYFYRMIVFRNDTLTYLFKFVTLRLMPMGLILLTVFVWDASKLEESTEFYECKINSVLTE